MKLVEAYPKTCRNRTGQLAALLQLDPGLDTAARKEIALAINEMADKACDLDEIVERILHGNLSPAEIGSLLIAFELTTEQIRSLSEIIDGKLYDIGDRLQEIKPAEQTQT